MIILPSDPILHIASYCSLEMLHAYSQTDKHTRKSCGMLALNELYTLALREFVDLQNKFVFRCKYAKVPENPNNIFIGKLIKDADKKIHLHLESFLKKFKAHVGFVIEENECFYLEDTKDILSKLEVNQFIAAVRLGDSTYKDVKIPKNTGYISSLYFQYINPDTANLVRTTTFPIKEIQCIFNQSIGISQFQSEAINRAAKKAYEHPNSFSGG